MNDRNDKPITVYVAMTANLVIAAAKFIAAVVTGSSAMFAEGIHSLVDTINELLLLVGVRRSRRPADDLHPFGYGKELYFWSLVVAMTLFGIGGGLSIYKGVSHILNPVPITDPVWNYIILAVAFVSEGTSWTFARMALHRKFPGLGLLRSMKKSKDPTVFMVAGEDTTALAGLVAAFFGVWLSHRYQNPYFDGAASVTIGLLLTAMAFFLASETKKLLVGERTEPEVIRHVEEISNRDPAVAKVRRSLTMHFGPHEILLAMDIEFDPALSADELVQAVDRLESAIKDKHPKINRIFIEGKAFRPKG
jgi:cation diffusion facilitator family transporter